MSDFVHGDLVVVERWEADKGVYGLQMLAYFFTGVGLFNSNDWLLLAMACGGASLLRILFVKTRDRNGT
jgi:hypothetical protein